MRVGIGKGLRLGVGLALAGVGCSAMTASNRDLRGSTAFPTPESRVLAQGPVRLLHANFDRRAGVRFYRVSHRDGGPSDCRTGYPVAWDGEADLDVRRDETICVVVSRASRISWHARAIEDESSASTQALAVAAH